jgi:uncharacterized protein (TIGR00159 family)
LEQLNSFDIGFLDILDIVLMAFLLYSVYRLVRGTVAIPIFVGIVIVYLIWKLTELLHMTLLSTLLGQFINVGVFALIVVFQQEIRKFLLLIGSTRFLKKIKLFEKLKFDKNGNTTALTDVKAIMDAFQNMSISKTGALVVIQRSNSLEFVKNSGDRMQIQVTQPILESIFFKNSPLHDGAALIEGNTITATRVILPITADKNVPSRFGLRHRAAIGITEKTDALALVVSEENGVISYFKNGEFIPFNDLVSLKSIIQEDLLV